MSRFLDVAKIVGAGEIPTDVPVVRGDYFRTKDGATVYIAYQHYDTERWVLIDLETGAGHGGNTKKSAPMLSEISMLSRFLIKVTV